MNTIRTLDDVVPAVGPTAAAVSNPRPVGAPLLARHDGLQGGGEPMAAAMRRADMMHYLPMPDEASLDIVLAEWQNAYPAMGLCVLMAERHQQSLPMLQRLCRRRRIPLVGALFPMLVRDGELRENGLWLLCFQEMPYAAIYAGIPDEPEKASRVTSRLANGVHAHLNQRGVDRDEEEVTLFMLFDATLPHIGRLLDQLYLELANRVNYAGVNAGSGSHEPIACLFNEDRMIEQGVLVMLLSPHRGAVMEHGYRLPDKPVYATSEDDRAISQINWRPAFEVYREWVRERHGVDLNPTNFKQEAARYPIGILGAHRQVLVCVPLSVGPDGSLRCAGEVPPEAVLTLLESPSVDSGHTLNRLVEGMARQGGEAHDLLLFYCAGRHQHLGQPAARRELRGLAARMPSRRMAGAVSLGEIGSCPEGGYPLLHGGTLAAMQWQRGLA